MIIVIVVICIDLLRNIGKIFVEDMTVVKSAMDLWPNPSVCFMYAKKRMKKLAQRLSLHQSDYLRCKIACVQ